MRSGKLRVECRSLRDGGGQRSVLRGIGRCSKYPFVTLKVLINKAKEGGYWAEVPALPGCVSQGETVDDVRANVREAIEGWLLAEGTTQAAAFHNQTSRFIAW